MYSTDNTNVTNLKPRSPKARRKEDFVKADLSTCAVAARPKLGPAAAHVSPDCSHSVDDHFTASVWKGTV